LSSSQRQHLRAQQPPLLRFEVATVKPAAPDDTVSGVMTSDSPGRIVYRNMTLRSLIYQAYGTGLSTAVNVSPGPDWANRTRFTIEALAPAEWIGPGSPTDRDFRAMLRALLEDRFALKVSHGTREIDPYVLVLNRPDSPLGPNIKPWPGTCTNQRPPRTPDPTMPRCLGAFRSPGIFLEGSSIIPLAELLSTRRGLLGGRIVQDRSGLPGPYNIQLEFDFAAAARPDYTGPSIFTVLKEQLGLKLEVGKGVLDLVIIESATLPGEN
jgi:uncharacterized protein (TIGR03435 family)